MNKDNIQNSDLNILPELEDLIEILAKHVHETWARKRKFEGWIYGPYRNDQKKEHPCLVDYNELPDSEKEYDRATARETISLIMKSGFIFKKNSSSSSHKIEISKR